MSTKRVDKVQRFCPVDNCNRAIDSTLFACRRHWRMLTQSEQLDIWDAYRQWQVGKLSGHQLRVIQVRVSVNVTRRINAQMQFPFALT
jgi:hypothetical protein